MITPIDQYVIDAVRKERRAQKISQAMLATGIGVSKGMISQAESPKYNTKYNFSHINEIARYPGLFAAGFPPQKPL